MPRSSIAASLAAASVKLSVYVPARQRVGCGGRGGDEGRCDGGDRDGQAGDGEAATPFRARMAGGIGGGHGDSPVSVSNGVLRHERGRFGGRPAAHLPVEGDGLVGDGVPVEALERRTLGPSARGPSGCSARARRRRSRPRSSAPSPRRPRPVARASRPVRERPPVGRRTGRGRRAGVLDRPVREDDEVGSAQPRGDRRVGLEGEVEHDPRVVARGGADLVRERVAGEACRRWPGRGRRRRRRRPCGRARGCSCRLADHAHRHDEGRVGADATWPPGPAHADAEKS